MADDVQRVWDLMDKISICLLTTWNGTDLHSRPMGAYTRRDEHTIYFLTDIRQYKDDEIRQYPKVCLGFADTSGMKFVSVTGRAEVSNDRAKIRELWSTPAKAWWDSENDPNIRVLKVTPVEAEFWDGPGKITASVRMAMAAAMGQRPDMGTNRKVAM